MGTLKLCDGRTDADNTIMNGEKSFEDHCDESWACAWFLPFCIHRSSTPPP